MTIASGLIVVRMDHKVLLLGAVGMLGRQLQQVFQSSDLTCWSKADLDITDAERVQECIQQLGPDIILNAAAYTAVDDCESHSALARSINGQAPGYLAAAAKSIAATLVHYSTDYIFSGDQATGYRETDTAFAPVNAYGVSKLLGEQAIQQQVDDQWNRYYIIRTAWLYGPHGKNFVDTMVQLGRTRSTVAVVNDQYGSPTYAVDLAQATQQLLRHQPPFGVYHRTNSGVCTWYDLAVEIFRLAALPAQVTPCPSTAYLRPARRPYYSILLNTALPELRPWKEALVDYLTTTIK